MAQLELAHDRLRLLFFGGKGGTGKTTCAAAAAIHLARRDPGKRILVVSTDPAHSLGDSLDTSVSDEPCLLEGFENLWLRELDPHAVEREHKRRYGAAMTKLAERGTFFDREDIDEFFGLPLPGLDEVMAVIEIANLLKTACYDLIVLDTAPTGHTLRLLSLPHDMERWLEVFELMQRKHRFMMRRFTGRYVKDDADAFLKTSAADLARVSDLFRDGQATQFVPVTIPEPLSVYETERLLQALDEHGIAARNVVVNRVPPDGPCRFCRSRKEGTARWLEEIERKFAGRNVVRLPLLPREIRAPSMLADIGDLLFGEGAGASVLPPREAAPYKVPAERGPQSRPSEPGLLGSDREFILFGGKGGVGKTSLAAATALRLAEFHRDQKILVFSTDPAHSLSDSFDFPVGDQVTRIESDGSLDALEIDAAGLLEDFKQRYRTGIEAFFDRFVAGGVDVKFDREVMRELMSLSPPGLDELMALIKVMELSDEYDRFVLDTAPTGHLLRFLEMPDLAREWLKTLLRILLKYRVVAGLDEAAHRLVELSRDIRHLKQMLTDPAKTEFVAVTIPEAMGLAETARLLDGLDKLGMPCRCLVVNMVVPETSCSFCQTVRQGQERYLAHARQLNPGAGPVVEVPLFPHPIRGTRGLRDLADVVYAPERAHLARAASVI